MHRHYCTLFDSKYLPQGLALYESLKKHSSEEFYLHILAMDSQSQQLLSALNLENVAIIPLNQIEELSPLGDWKAIRSNRTWQEYCWTMASSLTELITDALWNSPIYMGQPPGHLTYLDADLMFFSDPKVIFDEIGDRSIAVIPHRWNEKDRKRLEINGKFNVSWTTFKNNAIGRECLSTWARQCRERCSAKVGCGDQKYLDEFVKYGSELCVIENIGAGVAPWNLQNYTVSPGPKVDGVDVVFAHFHEYSHGKRLTNYPLRQQDRDFIYDPYVRAVESAQQRIASVHISA